MEYSQLIDRLLDAERSAQGIVQEVKGREQSMESELAQETAKLRETFFAGAEQQLRATAAETVQTKNAALADQDARRDDAMRRMEHAYEQYGDNWVDTLFHRIVDDRS